MLFGNNVIQIRQQFLKNQENYGKKSSNDRGHNAQILKSARFIIDLCSSFRPAVPICHYFPDFSKTAAQFKSHYYQEASTSWYHYKKITLFSIEVSSYEITGNANLTAQQNNVSLTVFNFTGSGAISVDCLAVNKRALVQLHFSFLLFNYVEMPAALSHVHTMYSSPPLPWSHVVSFFYDTGP